MTPSFGERVLTKTRNKQNKNSHSGKFPMIEIGKRNNVEASCDSAHYDSGPRLHRNHLDPFYRSTPKAGTPSFPSGFARWPERGL